MWESLLVGFVFVLSVWIILLFVGALIYLMMTSHILAVLGILSFVVMLFIAYIDYSDKSD